MCVHVARHTCGGQRTTFRSCLILSFHRVDPKNQSWDIRLADRYLYPLRHLASPTKGSCKCCITLKEVMLELPWVFICSSVKWKIFKWALLWEVTDVHEFPKAILGPQILAAVCWNGREGVGVHSSVIWQAFRRHKSLCLIPSIKLKTTVDTGRWETTPTKLSSYLYTAHSMCLPRQNITRNKNKCSPKVEKNKVVGCLENFNIL